MATTIPMLAPDGTSGDIPRERVQDAIAAGFKQAAEMTSPDGKVGYIPVDRATDALRAGFKLGSPDAAPSGPANAGFTMGNIASNVGQGLKELGEGAVQGATDIYKAVAPQKFGGEPLNNLSLVHHIVDPMQAEAGKTNQAAADFSDAQKLPSGPVRDAKMREAAMEVAGHGLASSIPVIGPYAASLGDQAGQGDVGGALAKGATQILAPKIAPAILRAGVSAVNKVGIPEGMYESALKPSTTLSNADRTALVQTGLEKGIPVSQGGLAKLGDLMDDTNAKIQAVIDKDPTRPITTVPAIRNLDAVRAKFGDQVTPQPDLNEINQVESNFLQNPKLQVQGAGPGPASLPASAAQKMKSGTYTALGDKAYGELKSANIESQKGLARGLKDEIATQFPEINDLNADDSRMLDLQPVLERAVNRIGNHQLIGIGTPIAGATGAALTGSGKIGMVVGTLKAVVDNPIVKSRLAIALSKANNIPFAQAVSKVNTYSASLAAAYAASQNSSSSGDSSTGPAN